MTRLDGMQPHHTWLGRWTSSNRSLVDLKKIDTLGLPMAGPIDGCADGVISVVVIKAGRLNASFLVHCPTMG
jgi:hypothetical protein